MYERWKRKENKNDSADFKTTGWNEPAFSVKWCKCISGEAENSGGERSAKNLEMFIWNVKIRVFVGGKRIGYMKMLCK